ncbi:MULTISPECIES: DNA-binding protein [Corynebacterium]|uniref:DNA-binding protein n=1 Tax=Corynebacterium TaxID=1716 RepID=UPI0009F3DF7B|nr:MULTISPECIES: DNA-binding protein [Corynebacterium]MCX2163748.1 DNA-binding protein [Corynebacterium auriscanis]WJY72694.1 hypothetical protein CAURIC_05290 [Corynebacterium auriscanis]
MFAIHASYRGRMRRRGAYVREVVEAFSHSPVVRAVEHRSVEDFVVITEGPDETGGVVLSLIQGGDFAIGIGTVTGGAAASEEDSEELEQQVAATAGRAVSRTQKATTVTVRIERPGPGGVLAPGAAAMIGEDIAAAFTLLAFVLSRRTEEGREATALLRAGHLQSEAAAIVGISKQAMSQRLAAAGWQAEQSGWSLAVHMLARVDELKE